ncbi:unnamed protein product [Chrysoparadoxa australica]
MSSYLALTVGGLEPLCAEEITTALGSQAWSCSIQLITSQQAVAPGQAGVGKLQVTTNAPPESLRSIPSVMLWFAFVACHELQEEARKEQFLRSIQTVLSNIIQHKKEHWDMVADTWATWLGGGKCAPETFRCTTLRDHGVEGSRSVKHTGTSLQISAALGDIIVQELKWRVSLNEYDAELVCFLSGSSLTLGLALHHRHQILSKNIKLPTLRPRGLTHAGLRTTLRPSTAHLMIRLALSKSQATTTTASPPAHAQVLLDPMCGVGTIPIISAMHGGFGVGGDIEAAASEEMGMNLKDVPSVPCDGCRWEVQALPLRSSCIDAVACDMPFGAACGKSSLLKQQVYPAALHEMARVLRPGGKAVLLSGSPSWIKAGLEWESSIPSQTVNIGGLRVVLLVMTRSQQAVMNTPEKDQNRRVQIKKQRLQAIDIEASEKRKREGAQEEGGSQPSRPCPPSSGSVTSA